MQLRLSALVASAALALTALVAPPTPPTSALPAVGADRPNVLLVTTDDQSIRDMEHLPFIREYFAGHGVTFTNAFSPYPLCCPARATLLTGLFNHNNGVISNGPPYGGYQALKYGPGGDETTKGEFIDRTIPAWFDAGPEPRYETSFVGKYLNGYGQAGESPYDRPPDWDYFAGSVRHMYDYYDRTLNENGVLVPPADRPDTIRDERYQTYDNQTRVEDRIREAVGNGAPFFIWQSEIAPHSACQYEADGRCTWERPPPAPGDEDALPGLPFEQSTEPNFNERVVADKPDYIKAKRLVGAPRIRAIAEDNRARAVSLQAVDRNVEDTVALLGSMLRPDGSTELDHTLLIFTSDNGFLLGQHRAYGKVLPYELSARVPLMMSGPGVSPGVVSDQTVTLVDVPATIADAARVEPLITQDGMSLLPIARGEADGWQTLPIEAGVGEPRHADDWFYRGVRTRRYVYLRYERTGEYELYDLVRDPWELNNVAYRATYRETRAALHEKLQQLIGCEGAACRGVSASGIPEPTSDGTAIHPDELASVTSATQVVTITAPTWRSARGTAVAWRKRGRSWQIVRGPLPVLLGANGMVPVGRVRHLRGTTPAGAFAPVSGLGLRRNPGTRIAYTRLDRNDYWPSDPSHAETYNVFQPRRSRLARWDARQSVRFAARRDRYPFALVLDQNLPSRVRLARRFLERVALRPADVRGGSFLIHSGSRAPKQGWVSMPAADLRWLLRWADPAARGTTFVVGPTSYLRDRL